MLSLMPLPLQLGALPALLPVPAPTEAWPAAACPPGTGRRCPSHRPHSGRAGWGCWWRRRHTGPAPAAGPPSGPPPRLRGLPLGPEATGHQGQRQEASEGGGPHSLGPGSRGPRGRCTWSRTTGSRETLTGVREWEQLQAMGGRCLRVLPSPAPPCSPRRLLSPLGPRAPARPAPGDPGGPGRRGRRGGAGAHSAAWSPLYASAGTAHIPSGANAGTGAKTHRVCSQHMCMCM